MTPHRWRCSTASARARSTSSSVPGPTNVDDAAIVRSDLGVAIFARAATHAGIGIPFPTYDVRIQGAPAPADEKAQRP